MASLLEEILEQEEAADDTLSEIAEDTANPAAAGETADARDEDDSDEDEDDDA